MNKSGWWQGLVKYGLGFGALGYVLWAYWYQLADLFRQPPRWEYLLAAAGLAIGCTALQLYRWYLLVRALDLPFSGRGAVRLGLVGYYYNSFLPGSVGGDAVKAFFIAHGRPDRKAAAVATVVADRLIGLFGLILYVAVVGGACWAAGDEQIGANDYLQTIIVVCAGLAAAGVAGYAVVALLPDRPGDRIGATLRGVPKLGGTLGELWLTAWTYGRRPGTVLAAVGLSAVVHTGMVLMLHLAVRVFPPADLSLLGTLPEHFVIGPMGFIGQAFFPAPGGVGGGEALFGYLYAVLKANLIAAGLAVEKEVVAVGVAGRLSMRLVEWTLGLVGYIAYLRMRDEAQVPPGA